MDRLLDKNRDQKTDPGIDRNPGSQKMTPKRDQDPVSVSGAQFWTRDRCRFLDLETGIRSGNQSGTPDLGTNFGCRNESLPRPQMTKADIILTFKYGFRLFYVHSNMPDALMLQQIIDSDILFKLTKSNIKFILFNSI